MSKKLRLRRLTFLFAQPFPRWISVHLVRERGRMTVVSGVYSVESSVSGRGRRRDAKINRETLPLVDQSKWAPPSAWANCNCVNRRHGRRYCLLQCSAEILSARLLPALGGGGDYLHTRGCTWGSRTKDTIYRGWLFEIQLRIWFFSFTVYPSGILFTSNLHLGRLLEKRFDWEESVS